MIIYLIAVFSLLSSFAASTVSLPGRDLEREVNEAIETASGETVIEFPKGTFFFKNEILVTKPGITLRGSGMKETILSFKNQKAGAQGILATQDRFRIEHLTVEDTAGNGIKVFGATNVQFDSVRVRWSKKLAKENGAYGVYPVLTKNVLIENCDVSDASDAGIYVGQSSRILIRNNDAHHNVAGIEIENSDDADVIGNRAYNNTAGILVFNLPDLVKKDGKGTLIRNNEIYSNNGKNFSTKGSIINLVPKGLGYFSLASQRTEITQNNFRDHDLSHVAVSNYFISERPVKDPSYDPMPKGVSIHGNNFGPSKLTLPDGSRMNFIIKFLAGPFSHDVIYDGIDDGTYAGTKPLPLDKICIGKNTKDGKFRFGNLHLDYDRPNFPLPGKITRSLKDHTCELSAINPLPVDFQSGTVTSTTGPSVEETRAACEIKDESSVNYGALPYDCDDLRAYNLFVDSREPRKNPRTGTRYSLSNELFTDYALKDRFIFLPPGTAMKFSPERSFVFPVGTVITKTFSLKDPSTKKSNLVETRLLIHRKTGWVPLNYVWENGKAKLDRAGKVFPASTETPSGEKVAIDYHVPSLRQCASCHNINGSMTPIGPRAKFLNHDSQLEAWAEKGILKDLPEMNTIEKLPTWNDETKPLDLRAKAYLEINCTHCHNPKGNAANTGLYFSTKRDSASVEMGHCKTPVAAGFATGGNLYDVTPGAAEKSILYFRIQQNHLAVKMPQLGRSVPHKEGSDLVKKWIDGMPKVNCRD